MKILFVQNVHFPFSGGTIIYLSQIMTFLKERGHEVALLTSYSGSKKRDKGIFRILKIDLNVNKKNGVLLEKIKELYRAWYNYFTAYFLIVLLKPDIIYAHNMEVIGVYPLIAANRLKKPIVLHAHNLFYADYKSNCKCKKKGAWFLPGAGVVLDCNGIIAVSNFIKTMHVKSSFSNNNVVVIHNGVPEKYLNRPPLRLEKEADFSECKMLFSGFVNSHKGIEHAIIAVSILKEKGINVKLDVVGKLNVNLYGKKLKQMVSEIPADIRFKGEMQYDELQNLRKKNFFCALVPSICQEAFSLVVVESMVAGLPVIASAVGGIIEIIEDNVTGKLVEPGNPEQIANAVMELWGNQILYRTIQQKAYEKVKREFVFENKSLKIEEYLLEKV